MEEMKSWQRLAPNTRLIPIKPEEANASIVHSIETLKTYTITELKTLIKKLRKNKTQNAKDAIKIIQTIIQHKRGLLTTIAQDRLLKNVQNSEIVTP